jgi:SanA protein
MALWVRYRPAPFLFEPGDAIPERFVAIVPGARVSPGGQPSQSLEDRLQAALELYRSGRVKKLLVSGDHHAPEYDEVNAMQRWLRERGVPDADVFLDHAGIRTLDTMVRASRVFQVRDAIVCTQRYHLPRAVFLAREAGIDAIGVAADRHEYVKARLDAAREFAARIRAFLDVYLLGTQPRHLGAPIPIDGDATRTHDRWTED